jgi:hypothetical protein
MSCGSHSLPKEVPSAQHHTSTSTPLVLLPCSSFHPHRCSNNLHVRSLYIGTSQEQPPNLRFTLLGGHLRSQSGALHEDRADMALELEHRNHSKSESESDLSPFPFSSLDTLTLDTSDPLFFTCWRRQSCSYCLAGDVACSWCATVCDTNPNLYCLCLILHYHMILPVNGHLDRDHAMYPLVHQGSSCSVFLSFASHSPI